MRKLLVVMIMATALSVTSSALAASQLVPAYFYPTGTPNPWHTMCDHMNTEGYGSTAIMNPASGPGKAKDANYAAALIYCQEEDGQNVIGYVDTDYTKRSIAEVEADVNAYYSFYPTIDGIFLDRMEQLPTATAECSGCTMTREAYYKTVYSYIHAKGSEADVIGNPGAAAATAWQLDAPAADEVVTFEGTSAKYATYSPPSWVLHKHSNEIANLVYAAPSTALATDCKKAESDNAGLLYVTNLPETANPETEGNPYEALPSYWTTETETC
jgi:Spherulation-specific family 4